MARIRVGIATTHPIQYYAPWFRWMAENASLDIKVFYLWEFGTVRNHDPGFRRSIEWDVPLLAGYDYEFVANKSSRPGTDHFWGIRNADLNARIAEFSPDAVLLIGYRYASMM